jgi:hypothetical protein
LNATPRSARAHTHTKSITLAILETSRRLNVVVVVRALTRMRVRVLDEYS